MRLWHQQLIPLLPGPQLLGQHRECCALRGKGWGRPHSTVNYVFEYNPLRLYMYHKLVMREMQQRGYNPAQEWFDYNYRGKRCPPYKFSEEEYSKYAQKFSTRKHKNIYPEHNASYIRECIENLSGKGVTCYYFMKEKIN